MSETEYQLCLLLLRTREALEIANETLAEAGLLGVIADEISEPTEQDELKAAAIYAEEFMLLLSEVP